MLSTPWPDAAGAPRVSRIPTDRGEWLLAEHKEHVALTNPEGETWQLGNVVETDDPDVIIHARRKFRAVLG